MKHNKMKFAKEAQHATTEAIKCFNQLFSNFTGQEINDYLWQMFRYSLTSSDREHLTIKELSDQLFFYESLQELVQGSKLIIGMKK